MEEEEDLDFEYLFFEEVFMKLWVMYEGFFIIEVEVCIKFVGFNKLEEYKVNKLFKFFMFMWNLLLWVMEFVVIMVLVFDNDGKELFDW